ncbi:Flp pilus assembly protein CpaB [Photobacterium sp. 1_MG-2023]|uniref:Flp pilus assembly protein CpaB n=1 Tax=Photobacterium sp. 1_MG-2023 TaxID=3062646 RepID=UPI0026E45786|nr:Flp pilus assembly protein CpaB [Photobacterium sp. 1_MG-2023]MDO6708221.1 Flp pilus assembly protein CpaB [Photobacterium sp. 1_MG-2023]
MKKILLFVIATGALLTALAFVWLQDGRSDEAVQQAASSVNEPAASEPTRNRARILVAARPLQAGALLRTEDLRWADLPASDEGNLPGLFLQGFIQPEKLSGSLMTRTVQSGQILSAEDVIRPEQSHYLSAMMAPGTRAVTLALTPEAVSHGLLRPGNRVDVILTSQNENASKLVEGETVSGLSAEQVLSDIKLLAIEAQLIDLGQRGAAATAQSGFDLVNVTFELLPEEAATLLLANKLGDLSLVLRGRRSSLAHEESVAQKVVWAEQVSQNHNPKAIPTHGVRIAYGKSDDANKNQDKSSGSSN